MTAKAIIGTRIASAKISRYVRIFIFEPAHCSARPHRAGRVTPMPGRRYVVCSPRHPMMVPLGTTKDLPLAAGSALPPPQRELNIVLRVNGTEHRLTVDARSTLLDALRDRLHLTGTKKGCELGQCGACTVLLDGTRINACLTLAVMHEGEPITTIDGLAQGEALHPLQAAFIEHDGFQCGYCTPGQIMSALGLIREGRAGSEDDIREHMSGNLCRCGAYTNIVAAIKQVADRDD